MPRPKFEEEFNQSRKNNKKVHFLEFIVGMSDENVPSFHGFLVANVRLRSPVPICRASLREGYVRGMGSSRP